MVCVALFQPFFQLVLHAKMRTRLVSLNRSYNNIIIIFVQSHLHRAFDKLHSYCHPVGCIAAHVHLMLLHHVSAQHGLERGTPLWRCWHCRMRLAAPQPILGHSAFQLFSSCAPELQYKVCKYQQYMHGEVYLLLSIWDRNASASFFCADFLAWIFWRISEVIFQCFFPAWQHTSSLSSSSLLLNSLESSSFLLIRSRWMPTRCCSIWYLFDLCCSNRASQHISVASAFCKI